MTGKEQQIEEMAKFFADLYFDVYDPNDEKDSYMYLARILYEEGYGNVKQAVKEFAEKIKNITCVLSVGTEIDGSNLIIQVSELFKIIDNLITELYGENI